jgi:hypothetical protein
MRTRLPIARTGVDRIVTQSALSCSAGSGEESSCDDNLSSSWRGALLGIGLTQQDHPSQRNEGPLAPFYLRPYAFAGKPF